MIGSDGPCTKNTDQGSLVCRPLVCTDAPNTLSTNADCQKFLNGCLTTGKGCVKTLQSCNTYQQSQICASLIGSEGPCTVDTTTGSTTCRALSCTDAPTSLTTNDGCNQFLKNCLTTGQGCVKTLGQCSTYTGTDSQCNLYIGSDGNCKGTGSTASQCQVRICQDAPKTINTDSGCNSYQKGCITNGYGCVVSLQLCQQYTGTATTCLLYKGSDGNCMAPSTQTTDGPCSVKVCSNATQNTNSNSGCQQYSYNCVTNGTACILQPTCETTQQSITCEGNIGCSSTQICLDRSSCTNYYSQSLCSLNQQQYKIGSKIYQRKCQWSTTCQNTLCSSLPATLTTDQACDTALSGCITKGSGCVDINDDCTKYQGLLATCQKYKGVNGTQVCTQLASETNNSASCSAVSQCSQAKLYSSVTQTSNTTCDTFLKGCIFNGLDNCTNGDCTTYFGTQTTCQAINTATFSNKPQQCWKVDQPSNAATACIPRTCAHAIVSASQPYNTDTLCQSFMQSCVWNGTTAGGCQDASTACTSYTGSVQQCNLFAQNGQKCTKTSGFCKLSNTPTIPPKKCNENTPPNTITNAQDAQRYCQQFFDPYGQSCNYNLGNCADASSCDKYLTSGSSDADKNTYCSKIKLTTEICTFKSGDYCAKGTCEKFQAVGSTDQEKKNFCTSKIEEDTNGIQQNCLYDLVAGYCYSKKTCGAYQTPASIQSDFIKKFDYCITQTEYDNFQVYCSYTGQTGNCEGFKNTCENIVLPTGANAQYNSMICLLTKTRFEKCQLNYNGSQCEVFRCDQQKIQLEAGIASNSLNKQSFCLSNFQIQCGYDDTSDKCVAATPCSSIKTYGTDPATNRQMCRKYSNPSCAYSSGNTCENYQCSKMTTNLSVALCQEYSQYCLFDGVSCIAIKNNCSNYVAQSTGSGQLLNCMNLAIVNGVKCGYATGSNCKDRVCQDISTGGSDQLCTSYTSGCIFNGVGCGAAGTCDTYIAYGTTSNEKGTFCNTRQTSDSSKCTYVAGATNCSKAQTSCTSYQTSAFVGDTPDIACNLLIDSNGQACQYNSGATCSNGDCNGAPATVNSDADCQAYKSFCKLDNTTPCQVRSCSSAPTTNVTDQACDTYRKGCVTNGNGCIELNSNCSDFKGTAATCATFRGNNGSQLCGNDATSAATDSCKNRSCQQNNTAKIDQDCDKWIPPNGNTKSCVWNGTNGCVAPQNCSSFQGTVDTCPKFTALDGPCQGSGPQIAACVPYVCLNAPANYNTDAQCKSWGPGCMTNGFGCIPIGQCSSIGSNQSCTQYQNAFGCDLAKTCKSKPQQCSDFTTATECNNIPIARLTLPGCGWNAKTNSCGILTCANLPLTLTTDQQCSQSITNCTTTGSGCIVKGVCSTYSKQVCGIAATTDLQKVCIWSNSVCRPIQCADNTTATSDSACDSYLTGCKSTGTGCGINLTCQQYTNSQICKKDYTGNPCIWIQSNKQGSCINYTKCSDVLSSSHKDCQNISPHCTTNGTNCVPITSCAKTFSQASCIIGTDGTCGWLPASGTNSASCALFTNCASAIGKTTLQCQAWSNTCISDGVSCISKSQCSSYQTQAACQNQGTDGTCIWIASQTTPTSETCRLQLCSDATTNINTHTGCSAFVATTQCTTSGTGCISLSTCSSYKVQAGCVIGTDGECFWQTPATNSTDAAQCRLKQCTDNLLTTSSACLNSLSGQKCVSNGVNCIKQATCSTYTTKEACLGGGSDGQCAFSPSSNSTTEGKCQLFSSCESANQDQITCNSRQDSCYFNQTTVNGTTTTSCLSHTCQTKAQASTCQPIPSFDLSTYQICVLTEGICSVGSPSLFTAVNCYQNSVATYTWNPATSKCSQCKQASSSINNTNNQTNNGSISLFSEMLGLFIIMIFGNL